MKSTLSKVSIATLVALGSTAVSAGEINIHDFKKADSEEGRYIVKFRDVASKRGGRKGFTSQHPRWCQSRRW